MKYVKDFFHLSKYLYDDARINIEVVVLENYHEIYFDDSLLFCSAHDSSG